LFLREKQVRKFMTRIFSKFPKGAFPLEQLMNSCSAHLVWNLNHFCQYCQSFSVKKENAKDISAPPPRVVKCARLSLDRLSWWDVISSQFLNVDQLVTEYLRSLGVGSEFLLCLLNICVHLGQNCCCT